MMPIITKILQVSKYIKIMQETCCIQNRSESHIDCLYYWIRSFIRKKTLRGWLGWSDRDWPSRIGYVKSMIDTCRMIIVRFDRAYFEIRLTLFTISFEYSWIFLIFFEFKANTYSANPCPVSHLKPLFAFQYDKVVMLFPAIAYSYNSSTLLYYPKCAESVKIVTWRQSAKTRQ